MRMISNLLLTYPSLSNTGSTLLSPMGNKLLESWVGSRSFPQGVEMFSRNAFTASTCFSVQNFLYNWPVYSSLQGCCEERELTRLPSDCIVLDIKVRVRFV